MHVSDLRGKKVVIDGYSWLHKGSYQCAMDLCLGKPTDAYITYVMTRINMLIRYNVTPIIVFDGQALPMKKGTESRRKE